jgi:hypothetical protein
VTSGHGRRASRLAVWVLALLTALSAARVAGLARPFFAPGWENWSFYDFRLWRAGLEQYQQTGRLYETEQPGYFEPGSHSLYKYPPTFAAVMRPFASLPQRVVGRLFLLAGFLAALLAALRPSRRIGWGLALVLVNWQPIWECLSDLQMELIELLCLGLTLLWMRRRRPFAAGVPIGVAGAFKVYPWLLGIDFLVRRRWRAVLGAVAGALGALLLAALVLSPRLSFEFFFRILPRLGGTSLSYDNVSLLALIGRLVLQLRSGLPDTNALDALTLEKAAVPGVRAASLVLFAVVSAALIGVTWRVFRRAGPVSRSTGPDARRAGGPGELADDPEQAPSRLGVMVCLLLIVIPTSWLSYQTLLALPVLAAIATSPAPRDDPRNLVLLALAAGIGIAVNSYAAAYSRYTGILSLLRSLIPFLLLAQQLRLVRRGRFGARLGQMPPRPRPAAGL